jgi:gliding motility-associated-like protein
MQQIFKKINFHKLLIISCLCVFFQKIDAQNLIPNPGFDTLTSCVYDENQLPLAAPWKTDIGSPDLYHECSTTSFFQPPHPRYCNYIPPKNGGGYVGFFVLPEHETVSTTLISPLKSGTQYFARFFIAPEESCSVSDTAWFTDAVQMQISSMTSGNYDAAANPSFKFIKDTANWNRISGCFTAQGGEIYLRLGNFRYNVDIHSQSLPPSVSPPTVYLYADDLFLGEFNPLPDAIYLCDGAPVNLDATFLDATYLWNNGLISPKITVSDTGKIWVKALIDGCEFTDTAKIINLKNQFAAQLGDSIFCIGETIPFISPLLGNYNWSTGENSKEIKVRTTGNYVVTVTNDCGEFVFSQQTTAYPCDCDLFVPNIFSPNDDGKNDFLTANFGCLFDYKMTDFAIFDRWGNQVFQTKTAPFDGWDGRFRGKKCDDGVYIWKINYQVFRENKTYSFEKTGDLTLAR